MDFKELEILKNKVKKSGIPRKQIAEDLNIGYSLLSNYLGGFIRMPNDVRHELDSIINNQNTMEGSI